MILMFMLATALSKAQGVLDEKLSLEQVESMVPTEEPGQGIHFEDKLSWDQVKEKAKAENKGIFLDFYTTWCGPCKWMDENVYAKKEVGDYINKNFVSVKVQIDRTAKDNDLVKSWYGTSKRMEAEYKVAAYPTLLFTNDEGIPSFKMDQILKPESFLKVAGLSLDSDHGFLGKLKQYQNGKNDSAFILDLIMHAQELGLDEQAEQIGEGYVSNLTEDQLFTKGNLMILYKTTVSSKDRGFPVFMNEAKKVEQVEPLIALPYSRALTDNIIREENIVPFLKSANGKTDWTRIKTNLKKWGTRGNLLLLKEEYIAAADEAERNPKYSLIIKPLLDRNATWDEILAGIKSLNAGKGEERLVGNTTLSIMNRIMQGQNIDFDKFYRGALYYEKNFSVMFNSVGLNNWAWFSFLKTNDKTYLSKAVEWSRKSVELDPSTGNMDTYANLLYKLGRQQEAVQLEEKVLAKDPQNTEFKDTLEKMKKGEPTWNRAF